ncbi:UNVERIFIED_CONTAM: Trihelix transcription factor GT-3b [Sesamum radiatum]|uniref:Trihelix transcription factor GT-3b n=1 Tax=Sesamum radiatum TaxID=300843 RepID=A0AAW2IMT8_SESRA
METKRNKLLWEVISTRMKEKGYSRSAEQCKCKWKNLVTRYKGCESMEAEGMRQQQFPFYNELQTIFAARMQRMLWLEAEGGGAATSSKKNKTAAQFSSDEEDENEDSEGEKGGAKKKRKAKGTYSNIPQVGGSNASMMIIKE